jgi:hypothetical protein
VREVNSKVLVLALAMVMLALPMSAVSASKPIHVEGTIELISAVPMDVRASGNSDNLIITMGITEQWYGSIEGVSEPFEAIWVTHNWVDPMGGPDTWFNVHEKFTFDTVTILGRSGSLTMELNIQGATGHWVILSGTGELAGLHGKGTGSLLTLPYSYSGQVHFDP